MKNTYIYKFTLILFALCIVANTTFATNFSWKTVDYVIDGDTFMTSDGKKVRLLNINTPEVGRGNFPSQPFADEARRKTTELIHGKRVKLIYDDRQKDRYGRLLAHIYTEDGEWINKTLIETGLAHVYTFPDNRSKARELIQIENTARTNKLGLWSHPRWQTYNAHVSIPDVAIGKFNLIEGTVHNITKVAKRVYINFGANWRTDFTVEIPKKYWDNFKRAGINIQEDYTAQKLQIRGVFKPVNGVLITVTHPEQLTVLNK